MDKNLQELIQYISSIDKPCAADILYSMQQVQTSLNKVLAHFKEKIKLEVDEDSFDDVGQLATYCNQLKEISNVLDEIITMNNSSNSSVRAGCAGGKGQPTGTSQAVQELSG